MVGNDPGSGPGGGGSSNNGGQSNGSSGNSGNTGSSSDRSSGFGICYDLIDDQSQCKSQDTVNSDVGFFASQGYKMIRTYDIGCNVGYVVSAAAQQGMKVYAGINDVSDVSGDVGKLISYLNGNWGAVDTVVVGNEQVNNGIAPATVIGAINQARGMLQAAGYTGNVVTVDVYTQIINNPSLCAASDFCAANAHGYFDTDLQAGDAGQWLMSTYNDIQNIANGKSIVITESGWPHAGSPNGAAVASTGDQQSAIASLKSAFANMPENLFLFEAFDASYKSAGSMGIEQSFGIYGH